MTEVRVGVVDVLVARPLPDGWRVLAMRRGPRARCAGAWETVHGSIEPGERPAEAALREVREETGLVVARLYNVRVHSFYLHHADVVQMAVVFVAFVDEPAEVVLGEEHAELAWLPVDEALERFAWPSERTSLREAHALLHRGDAGPMEDVLRVV